ncbi:MAG: hypothetical protein K2Y28_00795 [Burkholderiaceae bacterium]|nr:hypothetical protein [Burkholderiaceae bacterium]
MLLWTKSLKGRFVEGAAWALDVAIGFGLVSGAAVSAATGRFVLGGILAIVAFGVFLRFKRRRSRRTLSEQE